MSQIISILSQYPIIEQITQHLSALDLYRLATACTELYAMVPFNKCDGKGLLARQNFEGIYKLAQMKMRHRNHKLRPVYDEELEVRVWNLKCDAMNALPCVKCGIYVCEECRFFPRVRDTPHYRSGARPHLDPSGFSHDIVCYCESCDLKVEENLTFTLDKFCDCNQYTRWICLPCRESEIQENNQYYANRTKRKCANSTPGWTKMAVRTKFMLLYDHVGLRAFWCPCGERAPKSGNVRCAWCKRRHEGFNRPEIRGTNIGCHKKIPFFDDDPCYPKIVHDPLTGEQLMHPPLEYTGPISL